MVFLGNTTSLFCLLSFSIFAVINIKKLLIMGCYNIYSSFKIGVYVEHWLYFFYFCNLGHKVVFVSTNPKRHSIIIHGIFEQNKTSSN